MASLIKRKNSNVWYAQYYVTNSTTGELVQVRKSTGIDWTPRTPSGLPTAKEKAALNRAIEMERNAQGAIPDNNQDVQRIKAIYSELGVEISRSTLTKVSLRKYFSAMAQILTGEEMQIVTIKAWCNEWLERKARDSSKATMARYRGHAKAFIEWLGDTRASKPLESITTSDMEQWKRALQDRGVVGKTVISYLKDIGSIYRSAIREGLLTHNPVGAVETPDTSDSRERKPFTAEEVSKLLNAAPSKEWRGMILVAAFTGLRLGDAARLRWDCVDLQKKIITVIPAKTKRKKVEVKIPIHPDLLSYLSKATITEDSPDSYVFTELSKRGIGDRSGLSQQFTDIMATAKVSRGKPSRVQAEADSPDQPAAKGKYAGRVTYERGFHSLRHTFTTWLRTAGVSEEDRMALTGHSTRDTHAIYSHTDEKVLRDAVGKLSTLKKQKQ
jgi:integrase